MCLPAYRPYLHTYLDTIPSIRLTTRVPTCTRSIVADRLAMRLIATLGLQPHTHSRVINRNDLRSKSFLIEGYVFYLDLRPYSHFGTG